VLKVVEPQLDAVKDTSQCGEAVMFVSIKLLKAPDCAGLETDCSGTETDRPAAETGRP